MPALELAVAPHAATRSCAATRCDASSGSGQRDDSGRRATREVIRKFRIISPAHRARKRRPETPNRISAPSLGYEGRRTSCCVPHSTGTRAVRSRLYIPDDHAPTLIEVRAREAHRQPNEALRPAISSGHEAHETSDRVSFWPFARVASGKTTGERI